MTEFLEIMLESSLRVILVAAAVGLVLILARVHSSSLRHAAWVAVLGAMLLMPVLPRFVPPVDVPVSVRPPTVETYPPIPETPPPQLESDAAETPTDAGAPGTPAQPAAGGPIWPAVLIVVYAIGVLALLSRLVAGWLRVQRVVRTAKRVTGQEAPVYESAMVAAPLTVGVLSPRAILPTGWVEWPEEKVRAVVAHELAHVGRRDTLTSLLAHLNRCLFWFHPLAWWLEKKLALTAEHAADDAGVRAVGETRRYAEVLLDMAEAVRLSGRRLSWQGVGVDGTGLLGQRIDRILRGGFLRGVSPTRKALVALGCTGAIFLVAACRQQAKYAPLKPDPQYAEQQAMNKAREEFSKAALALTAEQVAELEDSLKKNPEDLETRRKLVIFYESSGRKVLGDEKTLVAFRAHKLWLIEHHPEEESTMATSPLSDPQGYEQARKLWLRVIERKDLPAQALLYAYYFLQVSDKPLAERLILRAQAADPKRNWSNRFGELYAEVIVGPDYKSPYAQAIRKRLDESADPALLSAAGVRLVQRAYYLKKEGKVDFDPEALGYSYVEKALKLDPNSDRLRTLVEHRSIYERRRQRLEGIPRDPSEAQSKAIDALPEAERFQTLAFFAVENYGRGESLEYYKKDLPGAKASWESARKYAEEVLRLAPKFRNDTEYGTALHDAHMALGMVAMRVDGDKKTAARHLVEASKAPVTNELAYTVSPLTYRLPVVLLKYGGDRERDAVIEYLERYGKIVKTGMPLLESAQQLRQGYMPLWYQYQAAKLK